MICAPACRCSGPSSATGSTGSRSRAGATNGASARSARPSCGRSTGIGPDQVFSLDGEDGDTVIDDGADIDLTTSGAERLNVVKRRKVEIKVNTKAVQISRGWHTGAEIKAAAIAQGVQIKPDFVLDLEGEGRATRVIGDDDRIFIRGGERFGAVDNHEDS